MKNSGSCFPIPILQAHECWQSGYVGRSDPRNSSVVYVTAIGPLWTSGGDRGLYKTTDGGATWKAIFTVSPDTGATDMVMDPKKPDTIYVAMLQRRRQVGQLIGGGPESGIFKSTDGGAKFTKLTKGLPAVEMGRVGLGINPKNPNTVYALVTAQRGQGGFFRSDDAGVSWARIGRQVTEGRGGFGGATPAAPPPPPPAACGPVGVAPAPAMAAEAAGQGRGRGASDDCFRGGDPGYYNEIFVDPENPETIYSTWTNLSRSEDGGKTWKTVPLTGVHVDHHEVVWDPSDHRHMIIGNDGGVYETYDGMKTWRQFTNLPLSQFYRIATDNARPFYNVCGGAQDNGTVCGPSRTVHRAGIRTSDWYSVGGGDGFPARVDPEDSSIVYAQSQEGNLQRLDLRTGVSVNIRPRPATTTGLAPQDAPPPAASAQGGRGAGQNVGRWHWDSPTIISPHSARRLFFAGERVYRSDNRGDTWTAISGDLTRNLDRTMIPIMGKVWPADSVAYMEATTRLSTITALEESPLLEGLLYTGSDDGLIQVSEDGGRAWRKVESSALQSAGVPEFTYVTDVQASSRDVNLVFATLNDWNRGNFKPYVVKSGDRGRTWTSIAGDLPPRSGAWAIVQDPVNGNLMFAGMEFGVYATIDGGAHWVKMSGVPVQQVRDITIQKREGDLVAGTFGRGVFILDDYTALRDLSAQGLAERARFYPMRDAYQYNELGQIEASWGNTTYPNPPYGALLTYSLGQAAGDAKTVIQIADDQGKQVRRIELTGDAVAPGLHRVAWDLRADPPAGRADAPVAFGGGRGRGNAGPPVAQARYTATIGLLSGDAFTAISKPVSFLVVPLPR